MQQRAQAEKYPSSAGSPMCSAEFGQLLDRYISHTGAHHTPRPVTHRVASLPTLSSLARSLALSAAIARSPAKSTLPLHPSYAQPPSRPAHSLLGRQSAGGGFALSIALSCRAHSTHAPLPVNCRRWEHGVFCRKEQRCRCPAAYCPFKSTRRVVLFRVVFGDLPRGLPWCSLPRKPPRRPSLCRHWGGTHTGNRISVCLT